MKKRLTAMLLSAMTILLPTADILPIPDVKPIVSFAATEIEYNGMVFSTASNDGKSLMLTRYENASGDIVIPDEVDGIPVGLIGDQVFLNNKNIKSVTLPDSIYYFGSEVFRGSSITSVNIPKSLLCLPSYAFKKCKELTEVKFHDNILVYGETAFDLSPITFPEDIDAICVKEHLFNSAGYVNCTVDDWKYRLSLGYSVPTAIVTAYVGDETEVTVPSDYRGIPTSISSIENLTVSKSVKKLTVKNINVAGKIDLQNSNVEELVIDSDNTKCIQKGSAKKLKKITFIGDHDELDIAAETFKGCTELTDVTFDGSFGHCTINTRAFEGSGIGELKLGDNADVREYAFNECGSLKNVSVGGDVSIAKLAFSDCKALENIDIDSSADISVSAFNGCTALTKINSHEAFANGDFSADCKELVLTKLFGADDVGFINQYVEYNVKKIVGETVSPDMSDAEKVKALHDWVCGNVAYATGDENLPQYHSDASVLLSKETVCEGYARMCNLLYHEAGLETYYVSSSNHAWNVVKVGGHYFHVDATWDDGEKISREWFMKSDAEMSAETECHSKWIARVPSSMHDFMSGDVPECRLALGDVNADGTVAVADLVTMSRCLLGKEQLPGKDYVLSDMNCDGSVDVYDLVLLRQKIIS